MLKKVGSLCVAICMMLSMTACIHTTYTESISDYLVTDVALNFPECVLFPKQDAIVENDVLLYQAECKSTIIDDDVYFILCHRYTANAFAGEITRFQESNAVYEDTLFALPAYVMLFTGDNYEYALLDEASHTITYVAAQAADWNIFEKLPEQYLPLTKPTVDICQYKYDFQ